LQLRKMLFFVSFLVIFLMGLCLAIFLPKKYEYSQYFEVGTYLKSDGSMEAIEKPEKVSADITGFYIPNIWRQLEEVHPAIGDQPKVQVVNIENTNMFELVAKGRQQDKQFYTILFSKLLQEIVKNQQPLWNQKQALLNASLKILREEILLRADAKMIGNDGKSNANSVGLLLPNQTPLFVAMVEPSYKLKDELSKIQINLAAMHPTDSVSDLARSYNPVGLSGIKLIAFFVVLGIVCGIVVVLISEAVCPKNSKSE
jgi:hypothetical protein